MQLLQKIILITGTKFPRISSSRATSCDSSLRKRPILLGSHTNTAYRKESLAGLPEQPQILSPHPTTFSGGVREWTPLVSCVRVLNARFFTLFLTVKWPSMAYVTHIGTIVFSTLCHNTLLHHKILKFTLTLTERRSTEEPSRQTS